MKPLAIAPNQFLIDHHTNSNKVAETSYLQACKLVEEFCPINDHAEFKKSFTHYVRTFIAKDKFLKHLDINNLFNFNHLTFLEKRYKEYFKDSDKCCFDYMATKPEHIEALKYAEKICKLLNEHPLGLDNTPLPIPLIKRSKVFYPDYEKIVSL